MLKQMKLTISQTYTSIKKSQVKRSVWICKCGQTIPKKGTKRSGNPESLHGVHVHCPNCKRIIASFVNPEETQ